MHDDWFDNGEFAKRLDREFVERINRLIDGLKSIGCGDPEPPWWNHEEEDVTYTSKTVFALLGVLLGNTLGMDLKPLLQQAHAIKLVEGLEDIEF